MALSLIKEFQLQEEQEILNESYFLLENVGTFLQPIRNKLDDAIKTGRSPFEGAKSIDKRWASEVLGVLLGFGESQDSAEMMDGIDGNLKRLFTFYNVLGDKGKAGNSPAYERNAQRAEQYIQHWAKNNFKSKVKEVAAELDLFSVNNPEDFDKKKKFVNKINKLSYDLLNQMNKIKSKLTLAPKDTETELKPA